MLEQRVEILQHYFEYHGRKSVQKLRTDLGRREVKNVKAIGIVIEKPKRVKPKTVRTPESIAVVAKNVCEAPSTSTHHHPQQLNISENSSKRILHKDLGMMPCKVQLVQKMKLIDHPMRFCLG